MKSSARWSIHQLAETRSAEAVTLQPARSRLSQWLKQVVQGWLTSGLEGGEPEVWHTCDPVGNIWWNAYDSRTGTTIHQLPEAEMRRWLEQRHRLSHSCQGDQGWSGRRSQRF